jgi:hypothetical protein
MAARGTNPRDDKDESNINISNGGNVSSSTGVAIGTKIFQAARSVGGQISILAFDAYPLNLSTSFSSLGVDL